MPLGLTMEELQRFYGAVCDEQPVEGLTHPFYRYPARFSPRFARAAIELFTRPGDLVLDPFMGGGTTLVEAMALGRHAAGCDVSNLAVFLTKAKTRLYSHEDLSCVEAWVSSIAANLNMHAPARRHEEWIEAGYQRHVSGRETWPIRKCLELALDELPRLPGEPARDLARCILLRAAQWALDGRLRVPSASDFRSQLPVHAKAVTQGAAAFAETVIHRTEEEREEPRCLCLRMSAAALAGDARFTRMCRPRLILTSPPYPGVHVLYHRWQVMGRKETPAPFWIADCQDGKGASFYTMGGRHAGGVPRFFEEARKCVLSLARLSDADTVLVQLLGFAEPEWQLPEYLGLLESAGFREQFLQDGRRAADGRIRRSVPNRKWHAHQKGRTASSMEVVLVHTLGH